MVGVAELGQNHSGMRKVGGRIGHESLPNVKMCMCYGIRREKRQKIRIKGFLILRVLIDDRF